MAEKDHYEEAMNSEFINLLVRKIVSILVVFIIVLDILYLYTIITQHSRGFYKLYITLFLYRMVFFYKVVWGH